MYVLVKQSLCYLHGPCQFSLFSLYLQQRTLVVGTVHTEGGTALLAFAEDALQGLRLVMAGQPGGAAFLSLVDIDSFHISLELENNMN